MRVGFVTYGTRGDVQPHLALAVGLRDAGHEVFLCAPRDFADLAAAYGIPFRPQSFSAQELTQRPKVQRVLASGSAMRLFLLKGRRFVMDVINLDTWNATRDADALIFKMGEPSAAYSIARTRGIPGIETYYSPLEPSSELPGLGMGGGNHGRFLNRLTSELTYCFFWRTCTPSANFFRREVLYLPRLPRYGPRREYAATGQPTLYLFSPTIVPKPADWRRDAHVIGFVHLPAPPLWHPPDALCRFLAAGPKPLCVGFSSMPSPDPRAMALAIIESLRRTGQRAVWLSGWGKLGGGMPLPENVCPVDDVPHAWLFPRAAGVIHHGGAGTVGSVLRAGIPSISVPHNFDQPFWSRRLYELGLTPPPIPSKQVSAERLTAAIRTMLGDQGLRRRVDAIGETIRGENGVARFVEFFEQYARRFSGDAGPVPDQPSRSANTGAP
jgi:UDP:flavonoid glycosyltransferase YjiC (YdhE family)